MVTELSRHGVNLLRILSACIEKTMNRISRGDAGMAWNPRRARFDQSAERIGGYMSRIRCERMVHQGCRNFSIAAIPSSPDFAHEIALLRSYKSLDKNVASFLCFKDSDPLSRSGYISIPVWNEALPKEYSRSACRQQSAVRRSC